MNFKGLKSKEPLMVALFSALFLISLFSTNQYYSFNNHNFFYHLFFAKFPYEFSKAFALSEFQDFFVNQHYLFQKLIRLFLFLNISDNIIYEVITKFPLLITFILLSKAIIKKTEKISIVLFAHLLIFLFLNPMFFYRLGWGRPDNIILLLFVIPLVIKLKKWIYFFFVGVLFPSFSYVSLITFIHVSDNYKKEVISFLFGSLLSVILFSDLSFSVQYFYSLLIENLLNPEKIGEWQGTKRIVLFVIPLMSLALTTNNFSKIKIVILTLLSLKAQRFIPFLCLYSVYDLFILNSFSDQKVKKHKEIAMAFCVILLFLDFSRIKSEESVENRDVLDYIRAYIPKEERILTKSWGLWSFGLNKGITSIFPGYSLKIYKESLPELVRVVRAFNLEKTPRPTDIKVLFEKMNFRHIVLPNSRSELYSKLLLSKRFKVTYQDQFFSILSYDKGPSYQEIKYNISSFKKNLLNPNYHKLSYCYKVTEIKCLWRRDIDYEQKRKKFFLEINKRDHYEVFYFVGPRIKVDYDRSLYSLLDKIIFYMDAKQERFYFPPHIIKHRDLSDYGHAMMRVIPISISKNGIRIKEFGLKNTPRALTKINVKKRIQKLIKNNLNMISNGEVNFFFDYNKQEFEKDIISKSPVRFYISLMTLAKSYRYTQDIKLKKQIRSIVLKEINNKRKFDYNCLGCQAMRGLFLLETSRSLGEKRNNFEIESIYKNILSNFRSGRFFEQSEIFYSTEALVFIANYIKFYKFDLLGQKVIDDSTEYYLNLLKSNKSPYMARWLMEAYGVREGKINHELFDYIENYQLNYTIHSNNSLNGCLYNPDFLDDQSFILSTFSSYMLEGLSYMYKSGSNSHRSFIESVYNCSEHMLDFLAEHSDKFNDLIPISFFSEKVRIDIQAHALNGYMNLYENIK